MSDFSFDELKRLIEIKLFKLGKYIKYLENELEVPISIISVGPKRHQIIHCK